VSCAVFSIIIGIIALLLILRWVFQPAAKTVQKEEADFMFGVSALVNEFETDEEMANSLYLDKVIQVNGTIDKISGDETIVVITLKDPESISGVLCSFDKSTVPPGKLVLGNKLTVKGICTGYLLDVVLTKCTIIE